MSEKKLRFWYKTQHFRHFSSVKCRRRRPEEKFRFTWYVFVKFVIDFDRKYIEEHLFFSQSISKFPIFWIRTKNVRIFLNPESGKKISDFLSDQKVRIRKINVRKKKVWFVVLFLRSNSVLADLSVTDDLIQCGNCSRLRSC